MDIEILKMLLGALHARSVRYVLVGGMALNVHGIIRTTEDVDFFVEPTPGNVAALRSAPRDLWSDPEIDAIRAEDLAGACRTLPGIQRPCYPAGEHGFNHPHRLAVRAELLR